MGLCKVWFDHEANCHSLFYFTFPIGIGKAFKRLAFLSLADTPKRQPRQYHSCYNYYHFLFPLSFSLFNASPTTFFSQSLPISPFAGRSVHVSEYHSIPSFLFFHNSPSTPNSQKQKWVCFFYLCSLCPTLQNPFFFHGELAFPCKKTT